MGMRILPLVAIAGFVVFLTAQPQSSDALTGQVTSADEGRMEGVLVSAKRPGSSITITAVSDERGRYRFPSAKLGPGQYSLRVRAAGYDLDGPNAIDVAAGKTATAGLRFVKARDLA